MTTRDDPATPGGPPAVAELACNGTTGTVLAVEPNRPRRVAVGDVGDWKLDLLISDLLASSTPRSRCFAGAVAEAGRLR